MISTILWVLGVAASVAALVVAAALKSADINMAYVHMAIAAASGIGVALAAMMRLRDSEGAGGGARAASIGLDYLGLVWTWGALTLFATYAFVLQWREWWRFVLAFALLAGACFWLAARLRRDAPSGADGNNVLKLARIFTIVHLGAGVITMLGLLVDGKMVRFLVPRHQDWAAQSIFFFGALAFAAIAWRALAAARHDQR